MDPDHLTLTSRTYTPIPQTLSNSDSAYLCVVRRRLEDRAEDHELVAPARGVVTADDGVGRPLQVPAGYVHLLEDGGVDLEGRHGGVVGGVALVVGETVPAELGVELLGLKVQGGKGLARAGSRGTAMVSACGERPPLVRRCDKGHRRHQRQEDVHQRAETETRDRLLTWCVMWPAMPLRRKPVKVMPKRT